MFDATALNAIADELNDKILHGRVQEIVQLDALSFGLEVYAQHVRHYLFVTVHPDEAHVHLVSQKLRGSGETPSAFLLYLRKFVEGAFVDAIAPLPHERVLRIRFDHSQEGVTTLVVETIGRYSNLVLLDPAGEVLEPLKRVTANVNRARVILPQHAYVPPPPQTKLDPATLELAKLARVLEENHGVPLAQVLVKSIAGISPLLAREIVFRIAGSTDAPAHGVRAELVLATLERLSAPRSSGGTWQPCVAYEEGEPVEFAPYPLTQYRETRSFDSMSLAVETFYGAADSYASAKEPLRVQLQDARDRLARRRDALLQSMPGEGQVERLRESGELVLAYQWQIRPGQTVLLAETEAGTLEIRLDAQRSPVENAQKYFKDYHRAKDAAARVPALLDAANADFEYAEQMLNDLELAGDRAEIDGVVQAATSAGLLTHVRPRGKLQASEPLTMTSQDGFTMLVGKNARQNEEITFHRARPDDLWLHVRNAAGAHVVVVRAGRDIPESTVVEAAQLALTYSQARGETRAEVMVAPRKNVHRMRGAHSKAGMVSVRGERTVQITVPKSQPR